MSTEQGKGKSEVEANRQQDQAAKGHIHCLGSWELAGNWGATENVSVVSWADLSEGGMRRGKVGASTSHIQEDWACGLSQKEEALEDF